MSAITVIESSQTDIINKSVDLYLADIHNRLSPRTAAAYSSHIDHFKQWWVSTSMGYDLRIHLQAYRAHLIERYESANSINLALSSVRSLYRFLLDAGLMDYDPTTTLKSVKTGEGVRRSALSRDQITIILQHLNNSKMRQAKRNRAIFLLLLMNGLRRSELCDLCIEDLGLEQGARVAYLKRKGYQDKSNYVKLQDKTYQLLLEIIGDRTEGYIFTGERTGGRLNPDTVSRLIKETFKACGYDSKQLVCHSLRHSFAVIALTQGASIYSIKTAMCHKSIGTTTNYLHSYNSINKAASDLIDVDFDA